MRSSGWPFLVACNHALDYRAVVAPEPVIRAGATRALADMVGDAPERPDLVLSRDLTVPGVGRVRAVFRAVGAFTDLNGGDGNERLRDNWGRPVFRIEGLILGPERHGTEPDDEVLDRLHESLNTSFRRFWESEEWRPLASRLVTDTSFDEILAPVPPASVQKAPETQPPRVDEPVRAGSEEPSRRCWPTPDLPAVSRPVPRPVPAIPRHRLNLSRFANWGMEITSLLFSPGRQLLAARTYRQEIGVWTVSDGVLRNHLRLDPAGNEDECNLTFDPLSERQFVTAVNGPGQGLIVLCDATQKVSPTILYESPNPFAFLTYSQDGSRLYAAQADRTLVLNIKLPIPLLRPRPECVRISSLDYRFVDAAFSRTGRAATVDSKGLIRIYDDTVEDGNMEPRQHKTPIRRICFSPDGRQLLSLDTESELWLWDLRVPTGQRLLSHDFDLFGLERIGRSEIFLLHDPRGRILAWKLGSGLLGTWESGTPLSHVVACPLKGLLVVTTPGGEILKAPLPRELDRR